MKRFYSYILPVIGISLLFLFSCNSSVKVNGGGNNDTNPVCTPSTEICGNGIDEDCDGVDSECPFVDCDKDDDGYDSGISPCSGNDCNDNDENINPGVEEICGNGIDEDCSGADLSCLCGNDLIDDGEDCDGDNFGGETCQSQGYDGGDLSCNGCLFDLSGCNTIANRLVMEDFEDQSWTDKLFTSRSDPSCGGDGGSGLGATEIVDYKHRDGSYSLRWDFCNDATDPITGLDGCNNVFLMAGDYGAPAEGTTFDLYGPVSQSREVYVQYWTRYETDNDPIDLYGQEKFAVGDGSGTVLTLHRNGLGSAMTPYYLGDDNPLPPVFIHDGEWHKIAYLYKYPDDGQNNSHIKGWVDDQIVIDWECGDLFQFTGIPTRLRMKYSHASPSHYPYCTSSPTHLDDYEVWDGVPDLPYCENGQITNLCWCGGSSREYGFCYNNYWNPNVMPSCVPSKEVCNDGIDNDCDGYSDCEDDECSYLGVCTNLECDTVNISIATRERHIAFFNGEYLGTYNESNVAKAEYSAPTRLGENTVAVILSNGEPRPLLAAIEYCGNVILSDTTWKTTGTKPFGWKEPGLDTSSWHNATFVSDWGPQGSWYYGLPIDWQHPDADWIGTEDLPVEGYYNGYFRKDFVINLAD